jgi:aminoglycoside phosphotransferase family enzyme
LELNIDKIPVTTNGTLAAHPQTHLLEAMMRPEFYPHPCERVEFRQTNTSWLLFAGPRVFKIKKPTRFGLVDATTPSKRYRLCRDEVLLNRAIAGDVYLGVSAIAGMPGEYVLAEDHSETSSNAQEFAVVMRRLPSDRFLDQMVTNASVSLSDIRTVARKLMAFHADASIDKAQLWGSAQAISQLVTSNLAEAQELAADSVTRASIAAVRRYALHFVITHQQSLDNRARDGRVRDGHGNLRCQSVCFADRGPVILGRVKYRESLRYADAALELASLAVDLDLRGRSGLADELIEAYVAEAHDSQVPQLLRLYKCHRAILQGKFEMLASHHADLAVEQRLFARANARRLFALAHG